jgi:hypothetical protein
MRSTRREAPSGDLCNKMKVKYTQCFGMLLIKLFGIGILNIYSPDDLKTNFLRTKRVVAFGSPIDTHVIPWESELFGFYLDETLSPHDITFT